MKLLFITILVLLLIHDGQNALTATANIHVDSTSIAVGTVLFFQRDPMHPVQIIGILDGLKSDTVHGFHIHRDPLLKGELNCTAAGPHFNPYNTLHGSPMDDIMHRHVGDLGNLTVNEHGVVVIETSDELIDLYNVTRSIANRSVVLHAIRDDGGKGGFPDSNATGNAGARIACGVISLPMEVSNTKRGSSDISITIADFFQKLFP